jgi:glutathione S-transferase
MIRIHHAKITRSFRIVWLCEELGEPYQIVPCSLRSPTEEFAALNPLRTLPLIEDGPQSNPVKMVESIAIMLYIMGKHMPTPLAAGPDDPARADWLQFLIMGEAGMGGPVTTIVHARYIAPEAEKRNWSVLDAEEIFLRHCRFIGDHLQGKSYLAGDRFTMADISVGYMVGVGQLLGLSDRMPANLLEYHKRLAERPAFERAAAA